MLKNLKMLIFIMLLAFFNGISFSGNHFYQPSPAKHLVSPDSTIRAIYIDNFFSGDSSSIILGDSLAEQNLFDYAANCGFNYLILYGLAAVPLGNNMEVLNALRSFIRRAHADYGMKIGCVGQSSKFFERMHEKYQTHDSVMVEERIDSYNLEFEFWKSFHDNIYLEYYCENYLQPNGYSCDSIGAFEFAMNELTRIDSLASLLADSGQMKCTSITTTEIYIGWINLGHAQVLAQKMSDGVIDRILGAVYQSAHPDGNLELYHFYHQTRRLSFLGSQNTNISFLPIFAVKENAGFHLRDWLDTIGSIPLVWEHYAGELYNDTSFYTQQINLKGYVWYNYSQMPGCSDSLNFGGEPEGPHGEIVKDSVYRFWISNTGNADRFWWDLPRGVRFHDAHHWDSEAFLVFSSDFTQGDSILVRAANRCHLSDTESFQVNGFNPATEQPRLEMSLMVVKDGIRLNVKLGDDYSYKIFDLQGKLINSGGGNTCKLSIPFKAPKGIFMFQLVQGRNQRLEKFLWN